MSLNITLNAAHLQTLDLSPVKSTIADWLDRGNLSQADAAQTEFAPGQQQICFTIDYPQSPDDPRELPEIPEVRLWFIYLDATYPWFLLLLDWQAGELARYAAMLVPHQFSPKEGIQYNPEALEIFVMQKVFTLTQWMRTQGMTNPSRIKSMAQMFGYDLDDELFALLN